MITIGRCSLSRAVTHDSPIATHPSQQRPQSRTENCPLQTAYINRVATAVPPYDVHDAFRRFAQSLFRHDRRNSLLFERMAGKSGIEHRYSCFAPSNLPEGDCLDAEGFYPLGDFPDTAARMRLFQRHPPPLAHTPPPPSPPVPHASARCIISNLELCPPHLKGPADPEQKLSVLLFGDGCAASIVSADPVGTALDSFHAVLVPGTRELITWNIREAGFDMVLSGGVPAAIHDGLQEHGHEILAGAPVASIDLWAVHPGGRTVLDAVERALDLPPAALASSRDILRRYGNMSSATVMFVIEKLLRLGARGRTGCSMSFGPGLIAETMLFHTAA